MAAVISTAIDQRRECTARLLGLHRREDFADAREASAAAVEDGHAGIGEVRLQGRHGNLREDDRVDRFGETVDFREEKLVVLVWIAGSQGLKRFAAQRLLDLDLLLRVGRRLL